MYPYWTDLDGVKRARCPRRAILEHPNFFNKVIGAHNAYSAGFLPRAGGMHDQHCNFPTLMGIVESANRACDKLEDGQSKSRPQNDGKVSLLWGGA